MHGWDGLTGGMAAAVAVVVRQARHAGERAHEIVAVELREQLLVAEGGGGTEGEALARPGRNKPSQPGGSSG